MKELLQEFDQAVQENFVDVPDRLLIALSGGIDSMALLYVAKKWCDQHDKKLYAVTIDHRLRANSKVEALEIQKLLQQENLHHEILTWDAGAEVKSNMEAKAREARYDLLKKFAQENNIKIIIAAHHLDDQIETFFIRLSRGSGIDGLAAMRQLSQLSDEIKLFRPFLNVKKSRLENFLVENNKKYFDDETNQEQKILRNKVRKLLGELESEDLVDKRIIQTINHFARAKDFLETHSEQVFAEKVKISEDGLEIDLAEFKNLHQEIALRLLVKIFHKLAKNHYKPRFERLFVLYQRIIGDDINKRATFAKTIINVDGERLFFQVEKLSYTKSHL